jgi:hypothetical protein
MTNNLGVAQVTAAQNQKTVTINEATGDLDAAITASLALDFTSGDITLTAAQFRENHRFVASNLSVPRSLTLPTGPSISRGSFVVDNSAGTAPLTVVHGTTSSILPAGSVRELSTNGATNDLKRTDGLIVAEVQTTDATPTVIASRPMAADSVHTVTAVGHGYEDATGDTYHFRIFGGARNEGGTSSAPTPDVTEVADAGAATWDATLVANDTTDVWEIVVTGEAAKTIDWTVTYSEIAGNGA